MTPRGQLELFALPSVPQQLDLWQILLPPCGRGCGSCEAALETNSAGTFLRCIKCQCVAPVFCVANRDA
jgi:hypothetical protein